MRFRLVPTDDKFFELFCESASNAATCARVLQELLGHVDDLPDQLEAVRALERQGDEVTRSIMRRLNTTSSPRSTGRTSTPSPRSWTTSLTTCWPSPPFSTCSG